MSAKTTNKTKGIIYIILSSLSFALMSTFVKLAGDISTIQKSFFRNFIALIFALIVLIKSKQYFKFKKENLLYLILRSFFGTIGIFFNFYSIEYLILADSSMINKLSPFFVIIFSYFILKESIKLWQFICILIAFLGSIFIINPTLILDFPSIFSGSSDTSLNTFPAFIGLLGAMAAGLAYTFVRKLALRGENGAFIVFFFSSFSCVVSLPYIILNYNPMDFMQVIYLLLAGIFAAFGQFAITFAYSNAPAREISIFDYSQIIFSAIIGYFVFNQIPDKYSILGYAIIILVALYVFFRNNKKA